jgi:hypothetical protein
VSCIAPDASRASRAAFLLAATIVTLLLVGCSDDSPTRSDTSGESFDLSSPAATLETLRRTCEERDSVHYAQLFEDDFGFYFSHCLGCYRPEHWGRQDEIAAAAAMFGDSLVDRITVNYEVGDAVRSDDLPGTYEVVVENVNLSVFTTVYGAPLELRVRQGNGLFYLRNSVGDDDRTRWRIVRWFEMPLGLRASLAGRPVRETTWSAIKWMYFPDRAGPGAIRHLRAAVATDSSVTPWGVRPE